MGEYAELNMLDDIGTNIKELTVEAIPDAFTVALVRPACKAAKMEPYQSALLAIGAIIKTVDSNGDVQTLLKELKDVDGIMLPGGNDISPVFYGGQSTNGRFEYLKCDAAVDRTDIAAARYAYDNDIPCFGICRGHQIMNVAREGTLYEDLLVNGVTTFDHQPIDPATAPCHSLTFTPKTKLGLAFGDRVEEANTNHHQAVNIPGRDMIVTARADDGVVEGTEAPNKTFYVSAQFHPERLDGGIKLFNRFARVCKARAAERKSQLAEEQARAAEEAMKQAQLAAQIAAAAAKQEEENDAVNEAKWSKERNEK